MDTNTYQLKLDAVLDAVNACLMLRLRDASAPLPSTFNFYTGRTNLVQVTVYLPSPGGSLFFDGTTYLDSDNNKIIVVQCPASGEHEIEAFLPSAALVTKPGDLETESEPSLLRKPQAPSTRVKLVPKIGYPPTSGEDT
jgi:hypothetical protein